jgi:hypothetical protein
MSRSWKVALPAMSESRKRSIPQMAFVTSVRNSGWAPLPIVVMVGAER